MLQKLDLEQVTAVPEFPPYYKEISTTFAARGKCMFIIWLFKLSELCRPSLQARWIVHSVSKKHQFNEDTVKVWFPYSTQHSSHTFSLGHREGVGLTQKFEVTVLSWTIQLFRALSKATNKTGRKEQVTWSIPRLHTVLPLTANHFCLLLAAYAG